MCTHVTIISRFVLCVVFHHCIFSHFYCLSLLVSTKTPQYTSICSPFVAQWPLVDFLHCTGNTTLVCKFQYVIKVTSVEQALYKGDVISWSLLDSSCTVGGHKMKLIT